MNYFEARRAESMFVEFKRLTLALWAAEDKGDEKRSGQAREVLSSLFYAANMFAVELNAAVTLQQLPPAVIGGPALSVNLLRVAFEPDEGYGDIFQVACAGWH